MISEEIITIFYSMDLITQGLLGAVVGQAGFKKTLGRKAIAYGAIIGMVPDADVFFKLFSADICAEMLYHRGFTHSLFFAPLLAPLAGWLCNYFYKHQQQTSWIGLWFWGLITHPLLDIFTVYGTQLLAPFSTHRFSFSAVPILDPFYSLPLLLSIITGWFLKKRVTLSRILASGVLLVTTMYLFLGVTVHDQTLKFVREHEKKPLVRMEAFTTMFSIFYRRVVIEEPHQFRVGYINMLRLTPIKWHELSKANVASRIQLIREIKIFYWFADDWVLPMHEGETLTFYDLRFGISEDCLKGYWGMSMAQDEKVYWEYFPLAISFTKVRDFWGLIFK